MTAIQEKILDEVFKNEPKRITTVMNYLAGNGWYYSMSSSWGYFRIAETCMKKDDVSQVNVEYADYYENGMKEIVDKIVNKYQKRKNVLFECFDAHKNKKYYLSTIGFLSQCDGLFTDITNSGNLFSSKVKVRNEIHQILKTKYTNNDRYLITASFLNPLINVYPHYESHSKNTNYNRHGILHGEIFDYGTKLNSIKAFSFLNYLYELSNINKYIKREDC